MKYPFLIHVMDIGLVLVDGHFNVPTGACVDVYG